MMNFDVLQSFTPVNFTVVKNIRLMNRVERKYLCTDAQLYSILLAVADKYYIQDYNGNRLFKYINTYFDTDALNSYIDHCEHHEHRQKIRIRKYDTGEMFLEVKEKNGDETNKVRVPIENDTINTEWLNRLCMYPVSELKKKTQTTYYRITLINKDFTERITIDTDISYYNYITGEHTKEQMNIIEIKQNIETDTAMIDVLNSYDINEQSYSKYKNSIEKRCQQC